jgi:Clustered mitochondria
MTIVREADVKDKDKTIPPVNVGGVAGGEKFIHGPMFFKFATDSDKYSLYGGDEFAAKAAGHELKSLNALIACNVPNLHFPLMALVDIFGNRVIAVSKLPISGKTLVYGSADGGNVIHDSSKVKQMVMRACLRLNLKGHTVIERSTTTPKLVYGPVDLEGHLGTDGRYYIVDTARLFPPQKRVPGVRGCHLYKLFRGEYLKEFRHPLSSDALTNWQTPEERPRNDADAITATRELLVSTIPRMAENMCDEPVTVAKDLKERLHQDGVGMRSLGMLWACLTVPGSSTERLLQAREVTVEMLAREFRASLNNEYRAALKAHQNPIDCAIRHLNLLCGFEPEMKGTDGGGFLQSRAFWLSLAAGIDARFMHHKKLLADELDTSAVAQVPARLQDSAYLDYLDDTPPVKSDKKGPPQLAESGGA